MNKLNAEALKELREKHGVKIERTPEDILQEDAGSLGPDRQGRSPRRTRSSRRSTSRSAPMPRKWYRRVAPLSRLTRPEPTTTGPRRSNRERSGAASAAAPVLRRRNKDGASMQSLPASEPARQPSGRYLATIRAIDGITTWTAYLFALLVIPLIIANVIEVFMRYVMNSPTSWALDVDDHVVRRAVHAGCGLYAAQGRACAHRHAVGEILRPQEGHHRQHRLPAVLPAVDGDPVRHFDRRFLLLAVDQREIDLRDLAAGALAAPGRDPARRGAAVPAGHLRGDEEPLGSPHRRMLVHHEKIEV